MMRKAQIRKYAINSGTGLAQFSFNKKTKHLFRFVEDHEFIFNGDYYDILFETETDGDKILHCLPDKKEKEIASFLQHDFQKHSSSDPKNKTVKDFFKITGDINSYWNMFLSVIPIFYLIKTIFWTDHITSPFFPPPEFS